MRYTAQIARLPGGPNRSMRCAARGSAVQSREGMAYMSSDPQPAEQLPADEYDRLIHVLTVIQQHCPLDDEDSPLDHEQSPDSEVTALQSQAQALGATGIPEPE